MAQDGSVPGGPAARSESPWDPLRLAQIEERRQAIGTAECADEVLELAGGTACFAGPGSWINQAAGLGLAGPVTAAELDALVEFYVSRGVEPKVEVASPSDPSLLAGLSERGFRCREFEHVWVRSLAPDEDAPPGRGAPPGLELREVDRDDPRALAEFARLLSRAFHEGEEPPEPMLRAAERVAAHPRVRPLLALVEGEPAGGGQLELFADEAALIGGAVLPAFRRRGIQAALTRRRLELARQAGSTWACVHSRPGIATERGALGFGFRLAYAKVILALAGPGLAPSP